MKIMGFESEKVILNELGNRIKQYRISLGLTQNELSKKCGISSSTETRIENGCDSNLSNYLRILSGLNILANTDMLIPEPQQDFKKLFEKKAMRQRVKSHKETPEPEWIWGEDRKAHK